MPVPASAAGRALRQGRVRFLTSIVVTVARVIAATAEAVVCQVGLDHRAARTERGHNDDRKPGDSL